MKNKNILYITIALAIYILFISFPTYLFIKDDYTLCYIVEIILRSVYLVFIILFSIFTKLAKKYTGKTRFLNMLFLLPLFFVAFFNIFYLRVVTQSTTESLWRNITNIFSPEGDHTLEILRLVLIIQQSEGSIVPPPKTSSPSYSTHACPGVIARKGSSKSTSTLPSGSALHTHGCSF